MNPIMIDWSIYLALGLAFIFALAVVQEGIGLIRRWRRQ